MWRVFEEERAIAHRAEAHCAVANCQQPAFSGHFEGIEDHPGHRLRVEPRHAAEPEIDRRWTSFQKRLQSRIRLPARLVEKPVSSYQNIRSPVVGLWEHCRAVRVECACTWFSCRPLRQTGRRKSPGLQLPGEKQLDRLVTAPKATGFDKRTSGGFSGVAKSESLSGMGTQAAVLIGPSLCGPAETEQTAQFAK